MDNNDLRTNKVGHQTTWSDQELLGGLGHFYSLHGRFPTAGEVDKFPYLPSARSIQRSHGGLVGLRQRLLPNEHHDFSKGVFRSEKAREADKRAKLYEAEFHAFLVKHFEEVSIHEHKIIRPGNVACDFFIYLDGQDGIIVDLFYSQDLRTLGKIVNYKAKRYAALPFQTMFVLVGNPDISQSEIDKLVLNRLMPLPASILVVTESLFKSTIVKDLAARSRYRS